MIIDKNKYKENFLEIVKIKSLSQKHLIVLSKLQHSLFFASNRILKI